MLGTPVDLGKVSCDSFVVAGYTDHLIPWDGAYRTTQLLGGESQFVLSNGGHIQAILNPPDNPKASYFTSDSLPATAAQWRDAATQVTGSWWTLWTSGCGALRYHAGATHACGHRRPPAAGTRTRALRPPVVPGLRTFARVDGHLLRVSVRGDGRPILLIMGLGGNIEMWDPLEREAHARGSRPSPTTRPEPGHSPPGSSRCGHTASPARLFTSWTLSACPTPTCSACRSGAASPRSWPCATPTESAG